MKRAALQDLLARHRAHDAHEVRMLQRIVDFVAEYPDCFERDLAVGHVTGSAWIVDQGRTHVLLTHHKKLDRWLQLGGHSDGDPDTLAVAMREGREESGLDCIRVLGGGVFDVDVHFIPERKQEPGHYHYDVRFLFEADRHAPLRISAESKDLAWVPLADVATLAPEESMLRMVRKTVGAG